MTDVANIFDLQRRIVVLLDQQVSLVTDRHNNQAKRIADLEAAIAVFLEFQPSEDAVPQSCTFAIEEMRKVLNEA